MAFSTLLVLVLSVTSSWAQTTAPTPAATTHKHRPTKPPHLNFVVVLQDRGNCNTLLALLNKSGLTNTLLAVPELTLFAPTDEAFASLPAGTLQALEGDSNLLTSTLTYHAVDQLFQLRGRYQDTALPSMDNKKPVRINAYGSAHTISAEGINITARNIPTENGYIQELSGVMTPPGGNLVDIISSNSNLQQLNSLLTSSGLRDVIQNDMNITVFVPDDNAFAELDANVLKYLVAHPLDLKDLLLYHVVNRMTLYSIGMRHTLTFSTADRHHDRIMTIEDDTNNIFVNDAQIMDRDISATNGVMHTIDKVLIPANVLLNIEAIAGISIVG